MRAGCAFTGALIGIVLGFVGWAPARIINERTYVSIGPGLVVGATIGWLLASWAASRRRDPGKRGD